jgi:hypothetical protein
MALLIWIAFPMIAFGSIAVILLAFHRMELPKM